MIHCLIIDDEPFSRELLSEFISKLPNLKLEGTYSSALKALEVLNKKPVDVIFLDIQMPDISGIEFLKTLDKKPFIIFTTAYAEYAIQGFELDAIDYLLKPFDFNRFLKAVNKISQKLEKAHAPNQSKENPSQPGFIFIKDSNKLMKVELNAIQYIKGTREYITVYTKGKKIMSLQTLRDLEQNLPSEFIRVHNSYIISLAAVESISKNEVEIAGEIIPIGLTFKRNFFYTIKKYFPDRNFHE